MSKSVDSYAGDTLEVSFESLQRIRVKFGVFGNQACLAKSYEVLT